MVDQRSLASGTIGTATATGVTILNSNPGRVGFSIQNMATTPLYLFFGSGATTTGPYHFVLKGGTAVNDGNGGTLTQTGVSCYTGSVTGAGTAATFTYVEY